MTMTGSVARNDHALLMACVQAPNHRYNMVHRLKESLCLGEEEIVLSSQEFADGYKEEGCPYFSPFVFDDMPIWRFLVQGVEILSLIHIFRNGSVTHDNSVAQTEDMNEAMNSDGI